MPQNLAPSHHSHKTNLFVHRKREMQSISRGFPHHRCTDFMRSLFACRGAICALLLSLSLSSLRDTSLHRMYSDVWGCERIQAVRCGFPACAAALLWPGQSDICTELRMQSQRESLTPSGGVQEASALFFCRPSSPAPLAVPQGKHFVPRTHRSQKHIAALRGSSIF